MQTLAEDQIVFHGGCLTCFRRHLKNWTHIDCASYEKKGCLYFWGISSARPDLSVDPNKKEYQVLKSEIQEIKIKLKNTEARLNTLYYRK